MTKKEEDLKQESKNMPENIKNIPSNNLGKKDEAITNKLEESKSKNDGVKVKSKDESEVSGKKNIKSKKTENNELKKQSNLQSKNNTSKTLKNNKKQENTSDQKNQKKSNDESNEFVEKLVSINRVAKVVKGGRRFSFAALVVVGDGNGKVGHGKGKAKEVPEAIKKATDEAKINMIRVPLRQGRTLHHDISGRFDSGRVHLRSAPSGTGVIAGGPMRAVFEALGIQDIVAKSVGSSNPHNMIRATFKALESASSPKLIAIRRGLKINDITKRRKNTSNTQEGSQDG